MEILYKLKSFFNNAYPLQSTKIVSYYLFNAVATIMKNNNHINLKGYREVLSYKAALKKGLNATIFKVK